MKVEKRSPRTGQVNVREIPVTEEQLLRWKNGELIQNAMPNLSSDDREFLMTGYTPEDWAVLFPPEEE